MSQIQVNQCRVCSCASDFAFENKILGIHRVKYFNCTNCGYLQTEKPYWLEEAYASAINVGDTGIMARNVQNVGKVIMTLLSFGCMRGRVVDHAGGYGILVRLLRDAGVDASWSDKYCENLLARGFESDGGRFDLLTAFEVFEHFEDPLDQLRDMLTRAPTILLTTELAMSAAPTMKNWWYLGSDHGQHIGFFRTQTLAYMAKSLACNLYTDHISTHVFSQRPVPLVLPILIKRHRYWRIASRLKLRSKTVTDWERLVGQAK